LWRRLFDRHYAPLYRSSSESFYEALGGDEYAWPDRIVPDPIDTRHLRSLMPPEPIDPSLPRPFARMGAAGKDIRWLYIAHAVVCERRTLTRSHPYTVDMWNAERSVLTRWIGDDRYTMSYGCRLEFVATDGRDPRLVRWCERGERPGITGEWVVRVSAETPEGWAETLCSSWDRNVRIYCFERSTHRRSWFTKTGSKLEGASTTLYGDGAHERAVWHDGHDIGRKRTLPDGAVATTTPAPPLSVRGRVYYTQVTYPNGDALAYEHGPDVPTRPVRYCVSPSCPDRRLAGRTFDRVRWACSSVSLSVVSIHIAAWTTGISGDDVLFRAYIMGRTMAWHPAVQAVAEREVIASGLPYN
jgi:hypothetical protein